MNQFYLYILIGVLGVISIISVVLYVVLHFRLKKIMLGKQGADLEDTLNTLLQKFEDVNKTENYHKERIEDLHTRMKTAIRGVHTLRFNPFPDSGSNQSFAISLVDENGDGIVLSSLYGRERMSIFAKQVKKKLSDHELTEEEAQSIDTAFSLTK